MMRANILLQGKEQLPTSRQTQPNLLFFIGCALKFLIFSKLPLAIMKISHARFFILSAQSLFNVLLSLKNRDYLSLMPIFVHNSSNLE